MKPLTPRMTELVELMRQGWEPVIFRDDPRTLYLPPNRHPAGTLRGYERTVLGLLERGVIRVKHNEPDRHSSLNGRLQGGATSYVLA